MRRFEKILVPTDFSKYAEKAYPVAQKIASLFGGKIDFIHVVPLMKYMHESIKKVGVPLDLDNDIYPQIMSETEHRLKQALQTNIADENRGQGIVKIYRKPAELIGKFAADNGYDMIVVGARGEDESPLFRGSTTEKVIRSSTVPVFSVDDGFNAESIEHILMPTDSSVLSLTPFPLAVELADFFGAEINIFHVLELYGTISENIPRSSMRDELLSIYDGIINNLIEYLESAKTGHITIERTDSNFKDIAVFKKNGEETRIPITTKIVKGVSAHYEIENEAEEDADLVIMATHGHSGFAHLILGSTAEKVAQYVRKPMITLRPPKMKLEKYGLAEKKK